MRYLLGALFLFTCHGFSQTIEEKKEQVSVSKSSGDEALSQVNQTLRSLRLELQKCYGNLGLLHERQAPDEEFRSLLESVKQIKKEIIRVEENWRSTALNEAKREEEGYALWDQEETTLTQLIMEYGSSDYLYIIPPETASLKLHMHSSIPIPREAWSDMLEIVLSHNGIGIKQLNPYTRQLYILKQDLAAVQNIVSSYEQVKTLPGGTRVFYVFTPPAEQLRNVFQFFERFADIKQTFVYQVGNKIAVVSSKEEVEKLINLYNTVWDGQKGKVSRVLSLSKIGVHEMQKILSSFFGDAPEKGRPPFGKIEADRLTTFPLGSGNTLILIGQQDMVDRAEKLVRDTEDQLQEPSEMAVFLYSCKHSDPTDLAAVLEKVYVSLLNSNVELPQNTDVAYSAQGMGPKSSPDGYPPNVSPLVVSPPPLHPGVSSKLEIEQGQTSDHFIPDPKTGNLLMVIRRDAFLKIKELLRKLDVPKKMVQIEVLLFEKKLISNTSLGLNLLKLGSDTSGALFEGAYAPKGRGVFEFFFEGKKSKYFPAFDVAYSFLMSQDDIQLNAAPSVVTVNQTPATIAIQEEISINNGAAPIDTNKGIAFEKSYTRAQYGITIVFTPTVHLPDNESDPDEVEGFITLQTDITFDTTKAAHEKDRPNVERRHIENEVRVSDGQTVIIGGLRRRSTEDKTDKIPLLGDIPGLGKLFGSTHLTDSNTEMFFFITPKIVVDPKEQFQKLREEELKKRPGDIPEYLEKLNWAKKLEKQRTVENGLKILAGRMNE